MQIIIFKSGKNKSSSHKISGLLFLLLVISIVASLTFMFSSASYIYGYKHGFEELHEDRIADIEKYKNEINSIKYENKEKMEFFSQKLISVSYQIQNLNSLGNKISNIVKLDKKEFNFKKIKNIGGIEKVNIEFEYDSDFDKYLDEMISNLAEKNNDLNKDLTCFWQPSRSPTKKKDLNTDLS